MFLSYLFVLSCISPFLPCRVDKCSHGTFEALRSIQCMTSLTPASPGQALHLPECHHQLALACLLPWWIVADLHSYIPVLWDSNLHSQIYGLRARSGLTWYQSLRTFLSPWNHLMCFNPRYHLKPLYLPAATCPPAAHVPTCALENLVVHPGIVL